MTASPGEEFRIKAAPTQEQLRKLLYLAQQDNDSVRTGTLKSTQDSSARDGKAARGDSVADFAQLITAEQQARQQRIDALNERLGELDRRSLEELHKAQEELDQITRNANRTKDGRLAFEAADGTIRDEHGEIVAPDEIDSAEWNPEAGSWEDYRDAVDRVDAAAEHRQQVEDAKDQLGANPTDEELDDLEARIGDLEAGWSGGTPAPSVSEPAQHGNGRSTSAAKEYDDTASEVSARLQQPFSGAVAGEAPATEQEPGAAPSKPAPPVPGN